MKRLNFIFLLLLTFVGLGQSQAFFVREVEPGIVELRGALDGSLDFVRTHVDKKRKWIYLEIKEGKDVRYFYGQLKDFSNLDSKKKLQSIQYGIGNRIQNSKGKIPFGAQRYFYPILDCKTAS